MATMMAPQLTRAAPAAAGQSRRPALPPLRSARVSGVRVFAAAGGPGSPAGTPPAGTPPGTPSIPTPGVFLRSSGAGGPTGTGTGMGGGMGGGNRPVGTGGSGSGGNNFQPPRLPGGWTWQRILLVGLGVAAAIPLWQYINRRYLFKPEPEHTIAKVEDTVSSIKHKSTLGKAASAVKHATVDPVVEGYRAVKHSDTGRAVQHKAEDVKDTVDIKSTDLSNKAERTGAHVKKDVKHAYEDTKSKAEDLGASADTKTHEAGVKGGRAVQRGKEKVSDVAYDAEQTVKHGGKGMFDGIKGAATKVGKALHVVADSTEKGTKKAMNKAEHALGMKHTPDMPVTNHSERKKIYYATGGTLAGFTLLAALYYWDKKGGDISGKMRKLQDRTKDAADSAMDKAKEALRRTTGNTAGEPTGAFRP